GVVAVSFAFTPARWRRATAALSSAAWRCSGVSEGGRGIGERTSNSDSSRARLAGQSRTPAPCSAAQPDDGVSIGSDLSRSTGRTVAHLARAWSTRKAVRHVARDPFRGRLRVVSRGHGPTDDEPVGALPDRVGGRGHPGLVVAGTARGAAAPAPR